MPITTSTRARLRAPRPPPSAPSGVRKRESSSTLAGNGPKRSVKVLTVLLGEHGGGHQHRHLAAVGHRLERRAQRDLGLAVADVARDQPVHGPRALHVAP